MTCDVCGADPLAPRRPQVYHAGAFDLCLPCYESGAFA